MERLEAMDDAQQAWSDATSAAEAAARWASEAADLADRLLRVSRLVSELASITDDDEMEEDARSDLFDARQWVITARENVAVWQRRAKEYQEAADSYDIE